MLAAIQAWASELGGVGLFVIAALDSSFLSFPQVNDLLIIYLSTKYPERMPFYASMTTAGSLVGCFLLYAVARKGGEVFLRKRFSAGARRPRHGALPALRPAGGGRAVAAAAADAVQDLRADGGRRRGRPLALRAWPSSSGAASAISARATWRCATANERPGWSGSTAPRSGIALAALALVDRRRLLLVTPVTAPSRAAPVGRRGSNGR